MKLNIKVLRFHTLIFKRIVLWLVMFLLVYGNESPLANGLRIDDNGVYKSLIDNLMIICFLCLIILLFKKGLKKDNSLFVTCILSVCVICSMIWNKDYSAGMILKIMTIISGYSIIKVFGINMFCNFFVKVMKFLAICSLVTYLCGLFLFPLVQLFPTITIENGVGLVVNISNAVFGFITPLADLRIRNYGVFREPGVYQAFLNIALIFHLFILNNESNKNNIRTIFIFSITILTTLSTSGIIAWALIMLCYYLNIRKTNKNNSNLRIFIVFIIVCLVSLLLIFPEIFNSIFGKINSSSSSTFSRINSISSNIYVFMQNILFGVGMTNLDGILQNYMGAIGETRYMHNTNTLITQFSSYGIIYGIVYFISFIKLVNAILYNRLQRFILFLAIMVILFSEKYDTTLLFSILIFIGYEIRRDYRNESSLGV